MCWVGFVLCSLSWCRVQPLRRLQAFCKGCRAVRYSTELTDDGGRKNDWFLNLGSRLATDFAGLPVKLVLVGQMESQLTSVMADWCGLGNICQSVRFSESACELAAHLGVKIGESLSTWVIHLIFSSAVLLTELVFSFYFEMNIHFL